MLYDGLCPLCSREVRWLRAADTQGNVIFEDIADPQFDPGKYGLTIEAVVGSMHGVLADGTVTRGIDTFVYLYRAVGWNWLAAVMAFRPIRPLLELGYRFFAWIRPRLSRFDCSTGRCWTGVGGSAVPCRRGADGRETV